MITLSQVTHLWVCYCYRNIANSSSRLRKSTWYHVPLIWLKFCPQWYLCCNSKDILVAKCSLTTCFFITSERDEMKASARGENYYLVWTSAEPATSTTPLTNASGLKHHIWASSCTTIRTITLMRRCGCSWIDFVRSKQTPERKAESSPATGSVSFFYLWPRRKSTTWFFGRNFSHAYPVTRHLYVRQSPPIPVFQLAVPSVSISPF